MYNHCYLNLLQLFFQMEPIISSTAELSSGKEVLYSTDSMNKTDDNIILPTTTSTSIIPSKPVMKTSKIPIASYPVYNSKYSLKRKQENTIFSSSIINPTTWESAWTILMTIDKVQDQLLLNSLLNELNILNADDMKKLTKIDIIKLSKCLKNVSCILFLHSLGIRKSY